MKKLFLASALAISSLALLPGESAAYWNSPQCCSGFGWLQCIAINSCPKIFYQGPLYNYGPAYAGYGYQTTFVNNPYCGAYVPAYPAVYQGQPGNLPTQWNAINPGVPNYPFVPGYPYGPPNSPADYYQNAAQYGQQAPIQQAPASTPTVQSANEPPTTSNTEATPAKTTSFSKFRARFQKSTPAQQ